MQLEEPTRFEILAGNQRDNSGMNNRQTVNTGTIWEDLAGYSRAVRVGNHICVSGTTATDSSGALVGGTDPAQQMEFALKKVEAAIVSLGGQLTDTIRTRVYVHNMRDWEAVSRVHGRVFAKIRPANTLVQAGLIGEGYLVEVDADALVDEQPK